MNPSDRTRLDAMDARLLDLTEKMGRVLEAVTGVRDQQRDTLDYVRNTAKRVGTLERWHAWMLGAAAAISASVSWLTG